MKMRMIQSKENWWFMYILEIDDGLYVGITSRNPLERWIEHINGHGATVMKTNKFLSVLEVDLLGFISRQQAEGIENEVTHHLKKVYGERFVTGGKFVH